MATSRLTIAYDPSTVNKESTNEYKEGTIVHLEAGTYSNFTFVNWTNSAGDEVSRERKMQYTVTANDETLTARYRFTPGSPGEPSEDTLLDTGRLHAPLTFFIEEGPRPIHTSPLYGQTISIRNQQQIGVDAQLFALLDEGGIGVLVGGKALLPGGGSSCRTVP